MQANPLDQLHPIIQSAQISWWPLAIGWWLLLVTGLILIFATSYFLVRRYKANNWRRQALAELRTLRTEYANLDSRDPQICHRNTQVTQLIRRILHGLDNKLNDKTNYKTNYKTITDEKWRETIEQTIPDLKRDQIEALSRALYAPNPALLTEASFTAIEQWVKRA